MPAGARLNADELAWTRKHLDDFLLENLPSNFYHHLLAYFKLSQASSFSKQENLEKLIQHGLPIAPLWQSWRKQDDDSTWLVERALRHAARCIDHQLPHSLLSAILTDAKNDLPQATRRLHNAWVSARLCEGAEVGIQHLVEQSHYDLPEVLKRLRKLDWDAHPITPREVRARAHMLLKSEPAPSPVYPDILTLSDDAWLARFPDYQERFDQKTTQPRARDATWLLQNVPSNHDLSQTLASLSDDEVYGLELLKKIAGEEWVNRFLTNPSLEKSTEKGLWLRAVLRAVSVCENYPNVITEYFTSSTRGGLGVINTNDLSDEVSMLNGRMAEFIFRAHLTQAYPETAQSPQFRKFSPDAFDPKTKRFFEVTYNTHFGTRKKVTAQKSRQLARIAHAINQGIGTNYKLYIVSKIDDQRTRKAVSDLYAEADRLDVNHPASSWLQIYLIKPYDLLSGNFIHAEPYRSPSVK